MERLTQWIDDGERIYAVPCMELKNNGHQKCCDKLAFYEDAEEQGLLVRLPCKIGDEVYQIAGYCWDCCEQTNYCHLNCEKPKYRIRKFIVDRFEVDGKNAIEIHGRPVGYSGILGITIFLTKEEAEAALERRL